MRAWLDVVWRSRWWLATLHLLNNDGFELAGYVAYTTILAIFPFMIFLTAVAGFFGDEQAADSAIQLLFSYMPEQVANTLAPVVSDVLTARNPSLVTIGAIGTLWSASSGIEALRLSLNRAYANIETRPFWIRRLQSIGFIILGSAGFLVLPLIIITGPKLVEFAGRYAPVGEVTRFLVGPMRYMFGGAVMLLGALVLHRWLPNRTLRWRYLWPGALLSVVMVLSLAYALSFYVANVNSFAVTYGSLGGVIVTLLFFYIAALMFAFGAEFNAAYLHIHADAQTMVDARGLHISHAADELEDHQLRLGSLPGPLPDSGGKAKTDV
jgi:membrane protein